MSITETYTSYTSDTLLKASENLMAYTSTWRPSAHAKKYNWQTPNGQTIPGIAIMHRHKVLAHMTPEEAKAMAEQLLRYSTQTEQENS